MENKYKYIRPLRKTDVESISENANNIDIWNNVRDYFPYPYTEANGREFIEYVLSKPRLEEVAIVVDGKAVGVIGFVPQMDVERLNGEIGYWIGKEYWGKGIVSAALNEFINYVFDNTNIIRLFAGVFDFNTGSQRVLVKNGFRNVGIMSNAAIKNDKIIDLVYYELIKEGV